MKHILLSLLAFSCMFTVTPAFADEPAPEAEPTAQELLPPPPGMTSHPAEESAEALAPAPAEEAKPVEASDESPQFGKEPEGKVAAWIERHFDIDFEFVNIFVYRNDADFDRTEPPYDYGQDVGFFGTFLKPGLTVTAGEHLRLYWEAEVGLDIWSRNNPDVGLSSQGDDWLALGFKQREVYGEATFGALAVKLGYQRTQDVTGLFVNHWMGAASLRFGEERGRHVRLFLGQLPDQTYEGWQFEKNNLSNDVFVVGLDGQYVFAPWSALRVGLYFLEDGSLVGYRRELAALGATAAFEGEHWHASVSAMGQLGRKMDAGADGTDVLVMGWAISAEGSYAIKYFSLEASASVMGSDDRYEGNDSLSFLWSGKRPGVSILLSENEVRDLGDNLDESMSSHDGLFYDTRTGLAGVDLGLYFHPVEYIKLGLNSAILLTLKKDNSLGGNLVAVEEALKFEAVVLEGLLSFDVTGGFLVPGQAGAALNLLDHAQEDLVYFAQAAVIMRF